MKKLMLILAAVCLLTAGVAVAQGEDTIIYKETTILDILHAMLIHGMIVQGDWQGDHYGPVSIGFPDAKAEEKCVRAGVRLGRLVKRLASQV